MERKTVTKWFWVWQFENEEKWLNETASNGWVLESVGFCRYTFVRCESGSYTVRTEMHPYDDQYAKFMEETGEEYVGRVLPAIGGVNLLIGLANSFNPVARIGWVNLLAATLLMYGLGRIHGKKEALEKERELHE